MSHSFMSHSRLRSLEIPVKTGPRIAFYSTEFQRNPCHRPPPTIVNPPRQTLVSFGGESFRFGDAVRCRFHEAAGRAGGNLHTDAMGGLCRMHPSSQRPCLLRRRAASRKMSKAEENLAPILAGIGIDQHGVPTNGSFIRRRPPSLKANGRIPSVSLLSGSPAAHDGRLSNGTITDGPFSQSDR